MSNDGVDTPPLDHSTSENQHVVCNCGEPDYYTTAPQN